MRVGRTGAERGQATVELAVLLPVVVVLVVLLAQVALVARDRVVLVHATRAAGRAVIVEPTVASARDALDALGEPASSSTVSLEGSTRPGELMQVRVVLRRPALPLLAGLVGPIELREQVTVRVEGG